VGYDLWKTQRANALSERSGRAASCRKESEDGEGASKVDAWTSIKAMYSLFVWFQEFNLRISDSAAVAAPPPPHRRRRTAAAGPS